MITDPPHIQPRLDRALDVAREALWDERHDQCYWCGELASSALATATAVSALSIVRDAAGNALELGGLIDGGVRWLVDHQNTNGGWGDTSLSLSNIATTMLVRAALELSGTADRYQAPLDRAIDYVESQGGQKALVARYGEDRTFAVPILSNCALAQQASWRDTAALPFELAWLPHGFYRFLRLHVVSYALPALIAIGQLIHSKCPSRNPVLRWIRNLAAAPTLRKLQSIQPESGGFLEAIPLTSFVTMSLAAIGHAQNPVVQQGVAFLRHTVRPNGSWPIDSNLSIWLTTLSVNAIAAAPDGKSFLESDGTRTRDWLLAQQLRTVHPYTNAAPGGWGWSHLSGSVPDADDTSGAVLALSNLPPSDEARDAVRRGLFWLANLQNHDGGWPTFCSGWGHLPFDRSGTDLTAHALRSMRAWDASLPEDAAQARARSEMERSSETAPRNARRIVSRALSYLSQSQERDGSWLPLWFGNQHVPGDSNPLYGTCKVLAAYSMLGLSSRAEARRGIEWVTRSQNEDGGWGGSAGIESSIEETSLAIEALAGSGGAHANIVRGVQWLLGRVESGDWRKPSPIGLYFAKLWYFERLYPIIFTVAALGRVRRLWDASPSQPSQ
jgi:squalene-hopene/tetraprenyl-beta-curcumene cyclase